MNIWNNKNIMQVYKNIDIYTIKKVHEKPKA